MAEGAAQFKFNNFQEIRSHSSHLFNERLAIIFYMLDQHHIELYQTESVPSLYKVYADLKQIYNNIRMLLRFNGVARAQLELETKVPGIYTMDVAFGLVRNMLSWCKANGFTEKKIQFIMSNMDNLETNMKDLLQYFMYFVRPDFRQKPDIDQATEKYKAIADDKTIEELHELAGKNHKIDFAGLGSDRIDYKDEIPYDPDVDGPLEEYGKQESEIELIEHITGMDNIHENYDEEEEDYIQQPIQEQQYIEQEQEQEPEQEGIDFEDLQNITPSLDTEQEDNIQQQSDEPLSEESEEDREYRLDCEAQDMY